MHLGFWKNLAKPIIGLSPMDGVSDAPFRFITAKYGKPSLHITEFTNVEALNHGAVKALSAFLYDEMERPVVAQIYGVSPEAFYKATIVAAELGFDGIDINMGCPSKAVSGNGAGAGLIRTPALAQQIIRSCQQAVQDWSNGKTMYEAGIHRDIIDYIESLQNGKIPDTSNASAAPHQPNQAISARSCLPFTPKRQLLPISVKTRIGYDRPVTEEWIKTLLECQPANISLHGRTLKQMYSGEADWNEIAKAARLVHQSNYGATILGNGDIKSVADAHRRITETGVDGVLIGRASFGDPWIFDQNRQPRSIKEKLQTAIEHAEKYEEIFGQNPRIFAAMKKHLGWYCSGFNNAKELRLKLMTANSATEVKNLIKEHGHI
ncbi:tRNA-dihydrouridine synthase [Candidatus Peregrinibacteria bacterium]|nr:tRNA-dihydrouridine synthase [Candidatus Peregrinibacteria bacterium]